MEGKYTKYKKWFIGLFALLTLALSIWFSKRGFGFNGNGENDWVGWVFAGAATAAQMMVQSDRKKITWTTLLVGVPAYGYSVYTNILGFHGIRGAPATESLYTWLSICGGFFIDFFPETALTWVFGEEFLGDAIGNLVYYAQHPEELLQKKTKQQQVFQERR